MATIVQRPDKNGQQVYRVQVRRKGAPPLSATFTKLSDARKWVQTTEAAIIEGRHFKTAEAKRRTLADLIDRYMVDILPNKGASAIRKQTQQLLWWKARLGYCIVADITPALIAEHRDILRRGKTKRHTRRANATVNHDATGKRPVGIREAWEYAVKRADVTDFHFHDLRHTFASYLAMNGASLLEIAEVLGHKTLAMVKRYAHLSEAHTGGVVERMNRAVFGE